MQKVQAQVKTHNINKICQGYILDALKHIIISVNQSTSQTTQIAQIT